MILYPFLFITTTRSQYLLMSFLKRTFSSTKTATIVAAMAILAASCKDQPTGHGTTKQQRTSGTTVDSQGKANQSTDTAYAALPLPVLDALFYEEGFDQELKTKLALTDPQIDTLQAVAREAVSGLSEGGGEYAGSARSIARSSEERLFAILGEQKARQLSQLVAQRYASGDVAGVMSTQPNAVPADTRLVVNAPAYRMDVYEKGQLIKTYRIGIGYPEFPLPTGMRRAASIIFNPTWTPPDEPWVKGKFSPGKKVAAGSKLNPLGPIKIPIGSPSLIHGGKAVAKLGTFASHGCVGLTNEQVQDVAVTLASLGGTPLTAEDVTEYAEQKSKTKSLTLPTPVPVELRYETIVAEQGSLHIYRDVYERGTNTPETARRVLEAYGLTYESLTAPERAALEAALSTMNRDAKGEPIAPQAGSSADTTTATGSKDSGTYKGVAASKLARAKKGRVTSTVVGKKEIVVPIAALQGKGYPAPVDLNTGIKSTGAGSNDSAVTAAKRR